jgi:hypothetical protein
LKLAVKTTIYLYLSHNTDGVDVVNAAAPKPIRMDFETYVATCRNDVQQQNDDASIAVLEKLAAQMTARSQQLTRRFEMRHKWFIDRELARLQHEITRRRSGENRAALERVLEPFVEAFKRSIDGNGNTLAPETNCSEVSRKKGGGGGTASVAATTTTTSIQSELESILSGPSGGCSSSTATAPPLVHVVHGDICAKCNVPMIILASDALLGCPQCSVTRLYIQATSSRIAYGEEVEFANFSYKRQNHFLEWLNTFQAKESSEVPPAVITAVMEELFTKANVRDPRSITQKLVRETLKTLKLRKFYDHTPQITARITGVLPPRMTPFQAEQVKLMFSCIQGPFNMHCPPERTNFLSYGYCLFKFCELLGYAEFLPCFTLLKGADKLACMDKIWAKICSDLDWEFIPSV